MRSIVSVGWTLVCLAIVSAAAWLLGMGDVVRASLQAGHLLDWIMGFLCLLWLLVILKVPWDLYFQAQEVAFELQRAGERNIQVSSGRAEYLQTIGVRAVRGGVGARDQPRHRGRVPREQARDRDESAACDACAAAPSGTRSEGSLIGRANANAPPLERWGVWLEGPWR